jgi:hypothetical protein
MTREELGNLANSIQESIMTRQELVDLVLDQIVQDVQNKDFTAIEELLHFVPETNLKSFLSEGPY